MTGPKLLNLFSIMYLQHQLIYYDLIICQKCIILLKNDMFILNVRALPKLYFYNIIHNIVVLNMYYSVNQNITKIKLTIT